LDEACTRTTNITRPARGTGQLTTSRRAGPSTLAWARTPGELPQLGYPGGTERVLEVALALLFGVFPAPGRQTAAASSLAQAPVTFDPSIADMRKYQQQVIATRAAGMVTTAMKELPTRISVLRRWLNIEEEEEVSFIKLQETKTKRIFMRMLSALMNLRLITGIPQEEGGQCDPDGMAYVNKMDDCTVDSNQDCGQKVDGKYAIYLCESYWDLSEREQVATLVHESSHHFGTLDLGYSEEECLQLPHSSARQNAESYQLLVSSLHMAANGLSGENEAKVAELRKELDDMVGLEGVKQAMHTMLDLVAFSKEREKQGLGSFVGQSLHMAFLGNPGTGKTVVARKVGQLLMAMGAIKPKVAGRPFSFREASRADLVGSKKGHTAKKVRDLVQASLGGVIFIDEAYGLVQSPTDNFGIEAVDALIKEMEDNREHVIIILAGYSSEMEELLVSNPGLKSRVPFSFAFPDYTCHELVHIGQLMMKTKDISPPDDEPCPGPSTCTWLGRAAQLMTQCRTEVHLGAHHVENRQNGNGRTMRNILEATYRRMALRVLRDIDTSNLDKFMDALRLSGNVPAKSCKADITIGKYTGPDLRCDFTQLPEEDILATAVDLLNQQIAPCMATVDSNQAQSLSQKGLWESMMEAIQQLREPLAAPGQDGLPRCEPIRLLLQTAGEGSKEGFALQQLAASTERTEAAPNGFEELDTQGFCKGRSYVEMPRHAVSKDVTLEQCAASCKAKLDDDGKEDCACFAFQTIRKQTLCVIYKEGVPHDHGSGRASAQCYRRLSKQEMKEVWMPGKKRAAKVATSKAAARAQIDQAKGAVTKFAMTQALMSQLLSLTGLDRVKAAVAELHTMVNFNQLRKKMMPNIASLMGQSFHMQFVGNPGTGKTKVARLVGRLLVTMGVIKGTKSTVQAALGQAAEPVVFVEASRADLVGEHSGHTAPLVQKAVESANGGVLFIDEAYALKKDSDDPFGQEAVNTLIKEIEDKRESMITIFAGYENEMARFFDSNPGFKSRVPFKIHFDDYYCHELMQIAYLLLDDRETRFSASGDRWLNRTIGLATSCCTSDEDCRNRRDKGNARAIRNILEASYRSFASRLVPIIHHGPSASILIRAAEFKEKRISERSRYAQQGGAWKDKLKAAYGTEAVCASTQASGPGIEIGTTWNQLCRSAAKELSELHGEDLVPVAVFYTSELLHTSCHEANVDLHEAEVLLDQAVRVRSEADWQQVLEPLKREDCEGVLEVLRRIPLPPANPPPDTDGLEIMEDIPQMQRVLRKLRTMVGLHSVKRTMASLFSLVRLSSMRQSIGLGGLTEGSFHMRFLGNPGTGKTAVARVVGEMLLRMKVVKGGKKKEPLKRRKTQRGRIKTNYETPLVFKEVSRADLVGTAVGHTAPKVREAVTDAEGGVFFIDEAYSLVRTGSDDFGQEAVDALIKEMEDKRDKVVVILAGYETEMDVFFDANPGFKSRVPLTFRFEDYSCSELTQIANTQLVATGIQLHEGADDKLRNLLNFATGCCEDVTADDCSHTRESGNGRTVRNIVEMLSRQMSTRVMNERRIMQRTDPFTEEELVTIAASDMEVAAYQYSSFRLKNICRPGGFVWSMLQAVQASGGLRQWFNTGRFADTVDQFHSILNEMDRLKSALPHFPHLKGLQRGCGPQVKSLLNTLNAKVLVLCGRRDGRGKSLLQALVDRIGKKKETPEGFRQLMKQVRTYVSEVVVLQRLMSGKAAVKPLEELRKALGDRCQKGLDALLGKQIFAPLAHVLKKLSRQLPD